MNALPAPPSAPSSRRASCVVLTPVYRATLEPLEEFSLIYSLRHLSGRHVAFIAPESLDATYYEQAFPGVAILRYADEYFKSIQSYNRLLLNPDFYDSFLERGFDFTLVLQTDAILLRDELDHWCSQAFDYIGAPWPLGLDLTLNLDCFGGDLSKNVRLIVGNGGLSLRRNAACAALLQEFPQTLQMFLQSGSSEDIFFALAGSHSKHFVMPNERQASLFALELQPERYLAINAGHPPMGGHAWWRYNQPFWLALLDAVPPILVAATPPGVPVLSTRILELQKQHPT